ncbi:hypothetical protein FD755_015134 [Muntiacus reevesi]|uniref:Large ribosomal subunit protein uL29 n=1 Tax=Muntiacus reevesi TaxID=9886 RepID=A0A5N3XLY5_MUNRE|nr:hypothetical protein FD755_015134 [Muntiacus reevesi]
MARIKAGNLRSKKEERLLKQEEELKVQLSQQHVAKATGSVASKLSKIRVVHKSITNTIHHVWTVINQTQKENLRKLYKGKKYETKKQQQKELLNPLWKHPVKD